MRSCLLLLCLTFSLGSWAQSSSSPNSAPANSQAPDSAAGPASKPSPPRNPNLTPPRSDRVSADSLPDTGGQSSSKDTMIDLSPPPNDAKAHPQSSEMLMDAEAGSGNPDVREFHPWDPHKAAKDIEVGDFYFKRKNYRAASDRYREALVYKDNDAIATLRLAICLEKMDQPDEARKEYEIYLKILPNGPQAQEAQKAVDRLKETAAERKTAQ
jgi:tetratricopeptide (TPR) repeat protein